MPVARLVGEDGLDFVPPLSVATIFVDSTDAKASKSLGSFRVGDSQQFCWPVVMVPRAMLKKGVWEGFPLIFLPSLLLNLYCVDGASIEYELIQEKPAVASRVWLQALRTHPIAEPFSAHLLEDKLRASEYLLAVGMVIPVSIDQHLALLEVTKMESGDSCYASVGQETGFEMDLGVAPVNEPYLMDDHDQIITRLSLAVRSARASLEGGNAARSLYSRPTVHFVAPLLPAASDAFLARLNAVLGFRLPALRINFLAFAEDDEVASLLDPVTICDRIIHNVQASIGDDLNRIVHFESLSILAAEGSSPALSSLYCQLEPRLGARGVSADVASL